jgi:hypothetical protein
MRITLIGTEVTIPTQIPPVCCCPSYRNGKDVCCGIMMALQQQEQYFIIFDWVFKAVAQTLSATRFGAWFKQSWLDKKELLAHRHRVDCDPFNHIVGLTDAVKKELRDGKSTTARSAEDVTTATATSPMVTAKDLQTLLADIISTTGSDQFLVCVFVISYVTKCTLTNWTVWNGAQRPLED